MGGSLETREVTGRPGVGGDGRGPGHPPKDPVAEACLRRPGVSAWGLQRGDHSEVGRGSCSVEGRSVEVTPGANLVRRQNKLLVRGAMGPGCLLVFRGWTGRREKPRVQSGCPQTEAFMHGPSSGFSLRSYVF